VNGRGERPGRLVFGDPYDVAYVCRSSSSGNAREYKSAHNLQDRLTEAPLAFPDKLQLPSLPVRPNLITIRPIMQRTSFVLWHLLSTSFVLWHLLSTRGEVRQGLSMYDMTGWTAAHDENMYDEVASL
jgi:hypothetical protein